MKTRIVSIAILAGLFLVNFAAFTRPAFGCGGSGANGGCRVVQAAPITLDAAWSALRVALGLLFP